MMNKDERSVLILNALARMWGRNVILMLAGGITAGVVYLLDRDFTSALSTKVIVGVAIVVIVGGVVNGLVALRQMFPPRAPEDSEGSRDDRAS